MVKSPEEKRRFIRLEIPLEVDYIAKNGNILKKATTKDISAEGMRLLTDASLKENELIELKLILPEAHNPVHAVGKAVWISQLGVNKNSFEIGIEFSKIEEDNKNTFLKFLCDIIYKQAKKIIK